MAMVFRFRMLSDENEDFLRDFEVLYDMDLFDFHRFISGTLGFDDNAVASFYSSNANWEKHQEYSVIVIDGGMPGLPLPMTGTYLGQLMRNNKDRLIYTFDVFADRSLFIELTAAVKAEEGIEYPRVIKAEGIAPEQYRADLGFADDIFGEAMEDFSEFEGDDSIEDDI